MDGVIKVNLVNFLTIGLMAVIFVFLARLAVNKWAPTWGPLVGLNPAPAASPNDMGT